MKFQFTLVGKPGHDIAKLETVFEAATWNDAASWATKFMEQIGVSPDQASTTITYAPREKEPECEVDREKVLYMIQHHFFRALDAGERQTFAGCSQHGVIGHFDDDIVIMDAEQGQLTVHVYRDDFAWRLDMTSGKVERLM